MFPLELGARGFVRCEETRRARRARAGIPVQRTVPAAGRIVRAVRQARVARVHTRSRGSISLSAAARAAEALLERVAGGGRRRLREDCLVRALVDRVVGEWDACGPWEKSARPHPRKKKAARDLKRALAGRARREGFIGDVKRWVVARGADGSGPEEVAAAAREVFEKQHRGSPVTAAEVRRWEALGDVKAKYSVGIRGGVGNERVHVPCAGDVGRGSGAHGPTVPFPTASIPRRAARCASAGSAPCLPGASPGAPLGFRRRGTGGRGAAGGARETVLFAVVLLVRGCVARVSPSRRARAGVRVAPPQKGWVHLTRGGRVVPPPLPAPLLMRCAVRGCPPPAGDKSSRPHSRRSWWSGCASGTSWASRSPPRIWLSRGEIVVFRQPRPAAAPEVSP